MNNNYNEQFEKERMFMDVEENQDTPEEKPKEKPNTVPSSGGEIIRPGEEDDED
ncbi:MAG: hypothetical protein HWD85_06085 [Flavobacteriaceae bacterium]|nr:hypothetical protein [Flavobacteriaceae bacterium]